MWVIGIDGGGSKCKANLYKVENQEYSLLATVNTGPANVFSNFEGAICSIDSACEALFKEVNSTLGFSLTASDCYVSLGCAGAAINTSKDKFSQWQHAYKSAWLTTDIHVSCIAANQFKECALVIIGTGSCIAVFANKQITQLGGHGFLLGDIASGAWLGKQAITWYLQSLDKPPNDKVLQTCLASILGISPGDIVAQYSQAQAGKFASLIPALLALDGASPVFNEFLQVGANYVNDVLSYHINADMPVFIDGGLAFVYQPLLAAQFEIVTEKPKGDACLGALMFALEQLNTSPEPLIMPTVKPLYEHGDAQNEALFAPSRVLSNKAST